MTTRTVFRCILPFLSCIALGQSPASSGHDSKAFTNHLRYGYPGGRGIPLDRGFYVSSYRADARVAEWSAYRLVKSNLEENWSRTDDFRPDPDLPAGVRSELKDYARSGFARGHLSPADDFTWSRDAMSATFLLSNMAPQHTSLNSGKWRTLESNVRGVVNAFDTCWILTGTVFKTAAGTHRTLGTKPDGSRRTIGKNKVWVPSHFYKIILAHDRDGTVIAWAFMMEHRNTKLPGSVVDYAVSIDSIEQATGLDFFPDLPDSVETPLERKINTSWPVRKTQ